MDRRRFLLTSLMSAVAAPLAAGGLPIEVRSLVGPGGCQPPQPVTVEGWFRAPRTGLGVGVIEATRVVCQ